MAPSLVIALGCCALLSACSGASSLEITQGPCVEGQSASCTCDDGSLGARRCGSDSEYGACQCGQPPTGGVQSTDPTAGSGMTAGDGLAGDIGVDPMAGTGAAGGAGTGPVDAGSAGVSGAAGMMGTGGMIGSGGMGTGPIDAGSVDSGNSGPGSNPGPGELYGDCLAGGACNDGLLCVSDGSSGELMSYCTTTCGAFGDQRCPRSDRAATCVLGVCVR